MESRQAADYRYRMRMAVFFFLLVIAAAARAETVTFTGGGGTILKAVLFRPEAAPVAPAVVALHGCGGPYPLRDHDWARRLAAAGHIVLLPDSFGSRGLGSQCRETRWVASAGGLRRDDALAAARWLTAQPGTPAGGVVIMGWSNGGSTTLATAQARNDVPPGLIRGFVAFYPGCRWSAIAASGPPILLLIGEADEWSPVEACRALARRVGARITLVTYPGAYHDFDAPGAVRVLHGIPGSQNPDFSVHVGENPAARADALARVPAFLLALPEVK